MPNINVQLKNQFQISSLTFPETLKFSVGINKSQMSVHISVRPKGGSKPAFCLSCHFIHFGTKSWLWKFIEEVKLGTFSMFLAHFCIISTDEDELGFGPFSSLSTRIHVKFVYYSNFEGRVCSYSQLKSKFLEILDIFYSKVLFLLFFQDFI